MDELGQHNNRWTNLDLLGEFGVAGVDVVVGVVELPSRK